MLFDQDQDALDLSDVDLLNPADEDFDSPQVVEALEQGAGEMESILAVRFPIPGLRALDPAPQTLIDANIIVARYHLDVRYGAREDTRQRYEDTISRLRRIAKGQEELLDSTGLPVTFEDVSAVKANGKIGAGDRVFTRDNTLSLMGNGLH